MSRLLALLLLVAACLVPACGTDRDDTARCGPLTVEQIDPDEGHLIGGAAAPTFLTNPPTSGPHTPGAGVVGRQREPVPPLVQVSTLETGAVIIQYGTAVDPAPLEPLVGDGVILAPGNRIDARAVVATGWLRKMTCVSTDVAALRSFISTVRGRYGGHGTTTTIASSSPPTTMSPTTTEG